MSSGVLFVTGCSLVALSYPLEKFVHWYCQRGIARCDEQLLVLGCEQFLEEQP